MILEIRILDDNGKELMKASGNPAQPVQWKSPPSSPIIVPRGGDNGVYKIYCVTATPQCVLDLQYGKQIDTTKLTIY